MRDVASGSSEWSGCVASTASRYARRMTSRDASRGRLRRVRSPAPRREEGVETRLRCAAKRRLARAGKKSVRNGEKYGCGSATHALPYSRRAAPRIGRRPAVHASCGRIRGPPPACTSAFFEPRGNVPLRHTFTAVHGARRPASTVRRSLTPSTIARCPAAPCRPPTTCSA